MESAARADAFGYCRSRSHDNRTAHAVSDRTDLLLRVGLRLLVEPRHNRFGIIGVSLFAQSTR